MTKQEYEAWRKETEDSRFHWQTDPIMEANTGTLLFYKGGENGSFIEVTKDGKATIGNYAGAVPHIGEALFTPKHVRQFTDQNTALARLIERMGIPFLLDFTGSRAYVS